jgi:hypothetical protein
LRNERREGSRPHDSVEPSSGLYQRTPGTQRKEGFMPTLENLKKEAKRWLKALRAHDERALRTFSSRPSWSAGNRLLAFL